MREVNLAGLDLNLLPPLEALLRRRNVTRAAADVGLSQPAMSRALARLREIFEDPLLVRTGGALAPTPLAEALIPKAAAALDGLRGLFRPEDFNPSTLKRAFRLAAADAQTILLAPRLVARLASEAPASISASSRSDATSSPGWSRVLSTSASRRPQPSCRRAPSASLWRTTGLRW